MEIPVHSPLAGTVSSVARRRGRSRRRRRAPRRAGRIAQRLVSTTRSGGPAAPDRTAAASAPKIRVEDSTLFSGAGLHDHHEHDRDEHQDQDAREQDEPARPGRRAPGSAPRPPSAHPPSPSRASGTRTRSPRRSPTRRSRGPRTARSQSQLPSSTSSAPVTRTTSADGRNTYSPTNDMLRPNAADWPGSPERFASAPNTWPAIAPPIHTIAAVMWRKSQSS